MRRLIAAVMLWLAPLAAASAQTLPAQVDPNNPPPPLAQPFGPQASIADNFTVADFLEPAIISHTDNEEIGSGEGAYRGNCLPTHSAFSDPIVFPGLIGGSPHGHTNFGNRNGLDKTSYTQVRTEGLSSCYNIMWRSLYWLPMLSRWKADGTRDVRMPDSVNIYYKRPGINMPQCQPGNPLFIGRCVPLPNGLKLVAGADMVTQTVPSGKLTFACIVYTAQNTGGYNGGLKSDVPAAANACPAVPNGETITKRVLNVKFEFPACWNGVDLDSANHRSHIADAFTNPTTGRYACPATHPYHMWRYTAQFQYTMDEHLPTDGLWWQGRPGWYFDSDRMFGMPMVKPGTSVHMDLWDGMSPYMKTAIEANCINRVLSCNDGDLGNGEKLKRIWTASVPAILPRPTASREPGSVKFHAPN